MTRCDSLQVGSGWRPPLWHGGRPVMITERGAGPGWSADWQGWALSNLCGVRRSVILSYTQERERERVRGWVTGRKNTTAPGCGNIVLTRRLYTFNWAHKLALLLLYIPLPGKIGWCCIVYYKYMWYICDAYVMYICDAYGASMRLPTCIHLSLQRLGTNNWDANQANAITPFLPTGQFLAPKLIILLKCLIDILFFKVLF